MVSENQELKLGLYRAIEDAQATSEELSRLRRQLAELGPVHESLKARALETERKLGEAEARNNQLTKDQQVIREQ